jgi:hypothetical protein
MLEDDEGVPDTQPLFICFKIGNGVFEKSGKRRAVIADGICLLNPSRNTFFVLFIKVAVIGS